MKDQAQQPAPSISGPSPRRIMRTAWAGVVAAVTAGGLLLAAMPSVPVPQTPDGSRGPVAAPRGAAQGASIRQVGTVPGDVGPEQIVGVLKRAERQAREQGSDFSPVVAQAAAELGMLYTTYLGQQAALAHGREGLRVQDAPVARGSRDDGTDHPEDDHGGTDREAVASAVQVSYVRTSTVEPDDPETDAAGTDTAETDAAETDAGAHEHAGRVTYEEVVVAAVRLASLLDTPAPTGEVDVQRTDPDPTPRQRHTPGTPGPAPGVPLRQSLLDAVQAFGGSTQGYANGRIPAAVLCPLRFAPGHLLRCDAAHQLTTLNAAFEREFGYPIPITDSYRSYVAQVAVAHAKPHLAAIPGTSNHGWGLAVDLSDPISHGTSPQYTWLRVHGPDYGWDNPSWARHDGAKPEPWHFEFFAAGPVPDRAIDPTDVDTWDDPADTADVTGTGSTTDAAGDTSARHETAGDTRPKDRPAGDVRKPGKKPVDKPVAARPTQQPVKPEPTPKPTPAKPKPTTPPTTPVPSPSPTPPVPSPEPTNPPSASPTPSPTPRPTQPPAQPSPEPSASPTPTPSEPEPSSSPSAPSGPLSGLVRGLGLSDDQGGEG